MVDIHVASVFQVVSVKNPVPPAGGDLAPLSVLKVTSTRLSAMRTSWRTAWQSPSASTQCFQSPRSYSGMSAGMGATVITRVVVGAAVSEVRPSDASVG